MKIPRSFLYFAPVAVGAAFLGIVHGAGAANSPATNEVAHKTGSTNSTNVVSTNAVDAELPIPLSVFDVTAKPTKDPFFPNSLRQPVPQATNSAPIFSASSFTLKGVSGSSKERLAIVNNRTLAAGEDAEVVTSSGKVKIHCVEVKETSVVLRLAGQTEPMEIALRKFLQ